MNLRQASYVAVPQNPTPGEEYTDSASENLSSSSSSIEGNAVDSSFLGTIFDCFGLHFFWAVFLVGSSKDSLKDFFGDKLDFTLFFLSKCGVKVTLLHYIIKSFLTHIVDGIVNYSFYVIWEDNFALGSWQTQRNNVFWTTHLKTTKWFNIFTRWFIKLH